MNIKDFLIDNYIYLLIVIGLIIITVIGFLADKKEKNKGGSGDLVPNNNSNEGNLQSQTSDQPMNYQPMGTDINNQNVNNTFQNNITPMNSINSLSNVGINPVANNSFDVNNNQSIPVTNQIENVPNNNLNVLPGSMQGTIVNPNMNTLNRMNEVVVPQSVEPINNVPVEPMYQPLSEQRSSFMPTEPNVNIQNSNPFVQTNDVNPAGGNVLSNVMPVASNPIPNNNVNMSSDIPSYNNGGGMNNMASSIPTPVNPVPPVAPIPPVPSTPVSPTPLMNPTPSEGTVPSPAPIPNGQVNFVYGNQQSSQNNNGYMQ